MTNPVRCSSLIWCMRLRVASTALALPVVLLVIVAAQSAQAQTYRVLHRFRNKGDGAFPLAGVVRDAKSNLYGTTFGDGIYSIGNVFKLSPTGKVSDLHTFTGGADGYGPGAGLIRDAAGNLYGTTPSGGNGGAGVVFKVSSTGKFTALYAFTGGTDGGYPEVALIRDAAGNLYGTTTGGGVSGCGSLGTCGVVFKVGTTGKETVLYSFTGGADGGRPEARLVRDATGNLYGTTYYGGSGNCQDANAAGCGVVFKVDTTGKETVLYTFTGGTDGAYPLSSLALRGAGDLYGTTTAGGDLNDLNCSPSNGCGVVFEVDSSGETVLYTFTGGADGANPQAGVLLDNAGNIYGTTYDTVFKLDTASKLTTLYTFCSEKNCSDGEGAWGLVRDTAGNLYGTTKYGGVTCKGDPFGDGCGVVFKLTP